MVEQPQYILKPNLKRLFIPQIFKLVALGVFLYLGLYMNIVLLGIEVSKNTFYVVDAVVVLVVIADLIMLYLRYLRSEYDFYSDRIEIRDKKEKVVYFSMISNLSFRRDFLDRMFNTCTILVGDAEIKSVENSNQIYFYIQKLVSYGRSYGYR